MSQPLLSPLHDRHVALGAKLADFGGWQMPIEYPAGGVIKEHAAVRETVGLFDVSHLGKASISGKGARDFVDECLTNELGRIEPGQAQYTLCCDPVSGGVVDDLIVYLDSADDVLLMPNAANAAEVVRRVSAAAPDGIDVVDRHRQHGLLAVQGPRSADVLDAVGLPSALDYMSFVAATFGSAAHDIAVRVCRTGYTGERGYELLCAWDDTSLLWDALLGAVRACGGLPAGLGARDTLRTEMGYPLHGQDLSLDITPVQARLGWAVGWRKVAFWGREALLAEREAGPRRTLRGIELVERGIPRAHMPVLSTAGEQVGEVTSGTFSPTRRVGVALAMLSVDIADDAQLQLDIRGRRSAVRVVEPPFVPSHVR